MSKKIQGAKTLITIIRQKDNSTLVQYVEDGVLIRKFVPTIKVENNMVPDEVLEQGIQYGYPWDEMKLQFDSRRFSNELHNVEVWTAEDVLRYPQKVEAAIRATLADELKMVLETARNETKGVIKHGK